MFSSSFHQSASSLRSAFPDVADGNSTAGQAANAEALGKPVGAALIETVAGTVAVIRGNGAVEAAVPGAVLQSGDFLQAGDSSVVVALANGSRIAVQERGQLIVNGPSTDGITWIEAAGGRFIVFGDSHSATTSTLVVNTPAGRVWPGTSSIAFQHAAVDGLRLILAEDTSGPGDGVLVENDFGRAVVRDGDEVAFVSGADQSPIIMHDPSLSAALSKENQSTAANAATSGHTLGEGLEVSPGGDLSDPGDAIVVTGDIDLFDLKPEPASLQEPTFTGVLASSRGSGGPLPMTEELLLHGQEQLLLEQQSQGQQSELPSSSSGNSTRQLRDWEPLGLVWDVFGNAEVAQRSLDTGPGRLLRPILPTEAGSMAMVVPGTQGMGPVDNFLGLPTLKIAAALSTSRPASVSAIRSTEVQLTAGSELSFDWFFDAANESLRHDAGLFVIDGRVFLLADATRTGSHGATGWRSFVYTVERTGLYSLGFVTVNDLTTDDPSRLFIDNVRRDRTFGDEFAVVDSGGGWRTLVQKPILRDDALTVSEDARATTSALALLANDIDPDPFDPMGIIGLDRLGTRGTPSFSSSGTISFDPAGQFESLAAGQIATTSFRYEVDVGNGVTGFGTVRVTIVGVNDAPVARPDVQAAISAETAQVAIAVLANDSDVDSDDDSSSIRVVAAGSASGAPVGFSGLPGDGIVYRPDGRFRALAADETIIETITYVVEDRHGARSASTASVTIVGSNDTPSAGADFSLGDEDSAIGIAVLANDTDPDTTDRLAVSAVDGVALAAGGSVTLGSGATVTRAIDGTLVYDPRGRFDGLALGEAAIDTFRYRIDDGHGGSSEALVTVRVDGRNDAPTAVADVAAADADSAGVAVAVLANDDDVDSDDMGASLRIVAASAASGAGVSFGSEPGALLIYDPAGRFRQLGAGETTTDAISYTIEDRHGARSTASVTMTVRGINDAPAAAADLATSSEDDTAFISLLANDSDPDAHDQLAIVAIDGAAIAPGGQVVLASGAVVSLDTSGNLSWSPAGRFDSLAAGEVATDGFRYRISDGNGGFAEADVVLRVEGRNDAPLPGPDFASDHEDGVNLRIDVLGNDDDIDSDDDATTLRVVAAQAASGATVAIGVGGQLIYSAAGYWDQLSANETGTDTITYTIEDRHGARSTGLVTVTINGTNDAPSAVADTLMIDAETVLQLPGPSIMANDRDPDVDDTKRIVAVDGVAANVGRTITLASGALLTIKADGTLTYDPNGRFSDLTDFERATDSFTYTIADALGSQSTATVTVEIQAKNEPPVAGADFAITDANSAVRIPVLINDTDPEVAIFGSWRSTPPTAAAAFALTTTAR